MAVPHNVEVTGEGVAGATAAALLFARGIPVMRIRNPAGLGPGRIVAVPMSSVELLAGLWGIAPDRLFSGKLVTSRQVAWDSQVTNAVTFPAVVCDTGVLTARLATELDARGVPATVERPANIESERFTILATGSARQSRGAIVGGRRNAIIGWVEHLAGFDMSSIVVKTFSSGWLFAAPHPQAGIALMLVRPSPYTKAANADDMEDAISEVFGKRAALSHIETTGSLSCAPALAPDSVDDSLAVGDAILSLDPIRGDGIGFAARGALLAHAVIAAGAGAGALRHYSARLTLAFIHHIEKTSSHYRRACNATSWASEIAAMEDAHAQATALICGHKFNFWMDGRELRSGVSSSLSEPNKRSRGVSA